MMNGIPNSPANGYFQVKRAMVASNTVVNCVESIVIGVGDTTKATLAPQASTFAKNVIAGTQAPLVKMLNPNADIHWDGNVFYGAETGLKDIRAAKDAPADIRAPQIDRTGRDPDWRTL